MSGINDKIADFLTTWGQIALYSTFLIAVFSIRLEYHWVRDLLRLYMLLAIVIGLFGILQFTLVNAFGSDILYLKYPNPKFGVARSGYQWQLGLSRATSVFAEPKHFGNFMIPPLLMSIIDFNKYKHILLKSWKLDWFIVGIFILSVLISFSTTAYAMIFVGLLLLPICVGPDLPTITKLYVKLIAFITAALLLLSVSPLNNQVLQTIERLLLTQSQLAAATNLGTKPPGGFTRYIWSSLTAITLSMEHPFIGLGVNQVDYVSNYRLWMFPPTKLLIAVGFPGFCAFWAFVGSFCLENIRRRVSWQNQTRKLENLLSISTMLVIMPPIQYFGGSRFNIGNSWFWVALSLAATIYVHANLTIKHSTQKPPAESDTD
jgi:hypothetical protein